MLRIDWKPFARDMLFWGTTIIVFVATLWDREISWLDATLLVAIYVAYVTTMFLNQRLMILLDTLTPYLGMYARHSTLTETEMTEKTQPEVKVI